MSDDPKLVTPEQRAALSPAMRARYDLAHRLTAALSGNHPDVAADALVGLFVQVMGGTGRLHKAVAVVEDAVREYQKVLDAAGMQAEEALQVTKLAVH